MPVSLNETLLMMMTKKSVSAPVSTVESMLMAQRRGVKGQWVEGGVRVGGWVGVGGTGRGNFYMPIFLHKPEKRHSFTNPPKGEPEMVMHHYW